MSAVSSSDRRAPARPFHHLSAQATLGHTLFRVLLAGVQKAERDAAVLAPLCWWWTRWARTMPLQVARRGFEAQPRKRPVETSRREQEIAHAVQRDAEPGRGQRQIPRSEPVTITKIEMEAKKTERGRSFAAPRPLGPV